MTAAQMQPPPRLATLTFTGTAKAGAAVELSDTDDLVIGKAMADAVGVNTAMAPLSAIELDRI